MLTQQRLKELLNYDPNTGEFRWKLTSKKRLIGAIAGTLAARGYRQIKIDNKFYYAHRLVWLYTYGQFPSLHIDHKNGNILDNRIANLREVSRQQNMQNIKRMASNTSGFTGVSWNKPFFKWHARISYNGKRIHLGYFSDIWDAICARKAAELIYQPLRVVAN